VSRHRICRLHPDDAAAIKARDNDLVEYDSGVAAPLRAWLEIDPTQPKGTSPLDAAGHRILCVSPGDRLAVRRVGPGRPMSS
jgi:hypothetical protein